jgi:hypothetical protein
MAKARRPKENGQSSDAGGSSASIAADGSDDQRMNGASQEQIAARAYELYLARGGSHGRDWDDWLAAERELSSTETRSERSE